MLAEPFDPAAFTLAAARPVGSSWRGNEVSPAVQAPDWRKPDGAGLGWLGRAAGKPAACRGGKTPLAENEAPVASCRRHLRVCRRHLIFCRRHLKVCQRHLIFCRRRLRVCRRHLISCRSRFISCRGAHPRAARAWAQADWKVWDASSPRVSSEPVRRISRRSIGVWCFQSWVTGDDSSTRNLFLPVTRPGHAPVVRGFAKIHRKPRKCDFGLATPCSSFNTCPPNYG